MSFSFFDFLFNNLYTKTDNDSRFLIMIKFSKKSQYGLVAMIYLAKAFQKEGEYSSLREISKKKNISFNYLEKILLKLEKSDLIKSKKGVKGGYRLEKGPEKIKIGEVVKTLEGSTHVIDCIQEQCSRKESCKAVKVWKKVQKALDKALNSITLKSLIKK